VRGTVEHYGAGYRYRVDLGMQPRQKCDKCGRIHWSDRVPLTICPEPGCGGRMVDEGLKRRQLTRGGFRLKKQAQGALTDKLKELRDGKHVNPEEMTLRYYVEKEWLPTIRSSPGRKKTTVELYATVLTAYVLPRIGDKRLQQLTGRDLEKLYVVLRESGRVKKSKDDEQPGGLGEHSLANIRSVLHRVLRDAVRSRLLPRSPADDVLEKPSHRKSDRTMTTWTAEQVRAFLKSVEGDRLYPLYVLVASTGMRRGEVCGLRWRDVDLEGGRLAVVNNLVLVDGRAVDSPPKTKTSRRAVTIPAPAVAVLTAWRDAQDAERDDAGDAWVDSGYVFTWQDGSPIRPDYLSKDFRKAVKAAKLPKVRLHDLRHGYATVSLGLGVHPKVVADQLGHSSTDITMDIYSHVMPSVAQEAAERVGDALFNGDTPGS
jgi:integrase